MWVKHSAGGHVNLDQVLILSAEDIGSGTWTVQAYVTYTNKVQLAGTWSTQAEAEEVIRELTRGVDPTSYGD